MARIGKVKFDSFGQKKNDDSSFAQSDIKSYHFYFEVEDIKKYFPKVDISRYDFKICDTREKAINLFTVMVDDSIVPKKMLGIHISIGMRAMTGYSEQRPKKIKDQPLMWATKVETDWRSRDNGSTHQLGLSLNRYYLYELSENKADDVMISVSDGWYVPSVGRKDYMAKPNTEKTLLIEWTEERERYLVDVCSKLDNLGTNLLLFLAKGMALNDNDFGKFIDNNQLPALESNFETKDK